MKESIKKLKNLKLNGKTLNNKTDDNQIWQHPAELEKKIVKRERIKLILFVLLSNSLVLTFTGAGEKASSEDNFNNIATENHSVVQLHANLLVPIDPNIKKEIAVFTSDGLLISKGYILPNNRQKPESDVGPWKIEIENASLSKVFNYSKNILRIVPKGTTEIQKRRSVHEIIF